MKKYQKYFPFDEQTCVLKFGSWTYDGFKVGFGSSGHGKKQKSFLVNSFHSYRAILYHIY